MRILGIEGGGTKTTAVLLDESGAVLAQARAGGSNIKLSSDSQLASVFRSIRSQIEPTPDVVSICLAGAITRSDHERIRVTAARVWPRTRCITATDRESALFAAFGKPEGIVLISGTGSSTFGMRKGRWAKCGGWGHILGDRGSAYDIARAGLRAAVREFDRTGKQGTLARLFLQALHSNTPEELVEWVQQASKTEIAAVASAVFHAARAGDAPAKQILSLAADELAESIRVVAAKLKWTAPPVSLTGGVFANQPEFFRSVRSRIRRWLPRAFVQPPKYDGAVGAALLGARASVVGRTIPKLPPGATAATPDGRRTLHPLEDVGAALTEQRNPRTRDIDKKSISQLFDAMMNEESRTIPAIRKQKHDIVRCIETITSAFQKGGRLFYAGAGTSGRLGVLDASECPPTFSVPATMVQGIMAGGLRALYASVEEAEDDSGAGAAAVRNRGITRRDVVVGIAASGRTPFVLGALDAAARIGAKTFLLTFNPLFQISNSKSQIKRIAVATGPEAITGSTRLKAGTATKLILNMLTTISMIRLGKVVSNLMVDVKPTNAKLRDRACRIVMSLRSCDYREAWDRLTRVKWDVKKAALGR